ncbi:MAG: UvrD-helicase domain-containing protein [Rhizonema sp. PD37]|nr:UvrD-helicase domain-containing protein [Rhizonema sp. PD37]
MSQTQTKRKAQKWLDSEAAPFWSKQQLAIFKAVEGTEDNLAISAVAGSGKTTSLLGIVAHLPRDTKVQVLMFNKSIAHTFRRKLLDTGISKTHQEKTIKVNTAHSCGLSLLCAYFHGHPTLKKNKYYKLAQKAIDDLAKLRADWEILRSLIYAARQNDEVERASALIQEIELRFPEEPLEMDLKIEKEMTAAIKDTCDKARLTLAPQTESGMIETIKAFNIDTPSEYWVAKMAIAVLTEGEQIAREMKLIDYTDMLWLISRWDLKPWQRDILLVDECQDANAAMIDLYRRHVSCGARLIMVGDPKQAIMGFAGAKSDSFAHLLAEFNPVQLPLSTCYRCPVNHLNLARMIVPQIKPKNNASNGTIEVIDSKSILKVASAQNLILCRTLAPLVSTCFKLIACGKRAEVRGRDLFASLESLALRVLDKKPWSLFLTLLNEYCMTKITALINEGNEDEAESLGDRYQTLQFCYDEFGTMSHSLEEFLACIEALFADDEESGVNEEDFAQAGGKVILSTIHKAKGDEALVVFILKSDKLPFYHPKQPPWQREQELNLVYVALTRAKHSLYLVPESPDYQEDSFGGMKLPSPTNEEGKSEDDEIDDSSESETNSQFNQSDMSQSGSVYAQQLSIPFG